MVSNKKVSRRSVSEISIIHSPSIIFYVPNFSFCCFCILGSHEYIEVIASTSKTKKQIPFLIELEFRDQFQIAKACEEYQKLVSCLPEFYIGKQEYLTAIVRVMCGAAKKSMKEKKMHLGPWRKRSFMQMKWSSFNPTYPHTQASKSHLCFSEAPTAVVVT